MNARGQILLWATLLLVGAAAVCLFGMLVSAAVLGRSGAASPAGWFSHQFRYQLTPGWDDLEEQDAVLGGISLTGKMPKRFSLVGGTSPEYEQVAMDWSLSEGIKDERRFSGQADVDLVHDRILATERSYQTGAGVKRARTCREGRSRRCGSHQAWRETRHLPQPPHWSHSPPPGHREINELLARKILKDLTGT